MARCASPNCPNEAQPTYDSNAEQHIEQTFRAQITWTHTVAVNGVPANFCLECAQGYLLKAVEMRFAALLAADPVRRFRE